MGLELPAVTVQRSGDKFQTTGVECYSHTAEALQVSDTWVWVPVIITWAQASGQNFKTRGCRLPVTGLRLCMTPVAHGTIDSAAVKQIQQRVHSFVSRWRRDDICIYYTAVVSTEETFDVPVLEIMLTQVRENQSIRIS